MRTDGEVTRVGDGLAIEGAQGAVLLLAAASSWVDYTDISGDPVSRCEAHLRAAATSRDDRGRLAFTARAGREYTLEPEGDGRGARDE